MQIFNLRIKFWQALYFTLLLTAIAINSCSANPPAQLEKRVAIKVNSGPEEVYIVPHSQFYNIGDTLKITAILNPPFIFNGWSGGVSGMENPKTIILKQPLTITINYTVALGFEISLKNSAFIDLKTFEFDVLIRTFTEAFELTAYQVALSYNGQWRSGNPLTFSYIAGTSDLTNFPQAAIRWDTTVSPRFTFASLPGEDSITIIPKKIGRFRVENNAGFNFDVPVGLDFFFDPPVNTIIAGEGIKDINQYGIFKALAEEHKVKVKVE